LQTFRVNIVSFFEVTKHAVQHMKEGGSVINTGSIQAYDPRYYEEEKPGDTKEDDGWVSTD
jgi:NAD(P)-dependent dehydrogenase (short-subunit alcohol dehydrogenase family)